MEAVEASLRNSLNPVTRSAPNEDAAVAAVMILLVKVLDQWNIVYTRRTHGVRTHQGEVSFPGGVFEKSDESLVDTALRETQEEIGIDPAQISILGGLEAHKTHYGLEIHPFVGIMNGAAEFSPNTSEVERIFMVPIRWLKEEGNPHEEEYVVNEQVRRQVIHYADYDGEHLWGITARITKELLAMI